MIEKYTRKNNLIFLRKYKKQKYTMYECKCVDCGRITVIYSNNFGKAKNCGCTKKDTSRRIGDVRHGLKLLQKVYVKNVATKLQCLCLHCGSIVTIPYTMFGRQKSCGCFDTRRNKNHPNFRGYEEIHLGMWKQYQRNASKREMPFTVSIEHAWELFIKQNRKCALSGVVIHMWPGSSYNNRGKATASLDRIDSNKGYIVGNIQWIHKDLNKMKSDFSQTKFLEWCTEVAKHANNK